MASEAVAKLSGLHYMSYDCVPVASPGAGAWTRLVLRASRIFLYFRWEEREGELDTLSRATKECNNYCCRSRARYANYPAMCFVKLVPTTVVIQNDPACTR